MIDIHLTGRTAPELSSLCFGSDVASKNMSVSALTSALVVNNTALQGHI